MTKKEAIELRACELSQECVNDEWKLKSRKCPYCDRPYRAGSRRCYHRDCMVKNHQECI